MHIGKRLQTTKVVMTISYLQNNPIRSLTHSVLRHCWLGDRKGIWPVRMLGVGLLVVTI